MSTPEESLKRAPIDDEPLTEEDRKAIDEARARSLRAGRLVTTEELRRRLKLEKKILL